MSAAAKHAFCMQCGCAAVSYGCAAGICCAPGWRVRANQLPAAERHDWAERAGIREFDGGAAPHEAELSAFRELGWDQLPAPVVTPPSAPKPERKRKR